MKLNLLTLAAISLLSALSANAQSRFVPEDDIYYQPKQSNAVVEKKKSENNKNNVIVVSENTPAEITIKTNPGNTTVIRDFDEDAYNRRGSAYLEDIAEEELAYEDDTNVIYVNPDQGYYVNNFNGNQNDFEYAERIRKFHNPKFTIHISDPMYTDIYFLNSSDWNVYVDNSYAWVTPTWTNPYYWDYMWSPYSYNSMSWRWNSGYASWGFGFGWNRPCHGGYYGYYDPWYGGGYYGHHYPGYGHHYPHHGVGYPLRPNNGYYSSGRVYGSRNDTRTSSSRNYSAGTRQVSSSRNNQSTRPSSGRVSNNTSRTESSRNNGNVSSRPNGNTNNRGNSTARPNNQNSRPNNSQATRPSTNNGNKASNVTRPQRNPNGGSVSSANSANLSSRPSVTKENVMSQGSSNTKRADGSSVRPTNTTRPNNNSVSSRPQNSSSSSSGSSRSESYSSGSSRSESYGSSSSRSSSSGSSSTRSSSGSASRGGGRR